MTVGRVQDAAQRRDRDRQPVREAVWLLVGPEQLGGGLAGDRPAPARNEDLEQVAGLARPPFRQLHGPAVPNDREPAEGSNRDPAPGSGPEHRQHPGDTGGLGEPKAETLELVLRGASASPRRPARPTRARARPRSAAGRERPPAPTTARSPPRGARTTWSGRRSQAPEAPSPPRPSRARSRSARPRGPPRRVPRPCRRRLSRAPPSPPRAGRPGERIRGELRPRPHRSPGGLQPPAPRPRALEPARRGRRSASGHVPAASRARGPARGRRGPARSHRAGDAPSRDYEGPTKRGPIRCAPGSPGPPRGRPSPRRRVRAGTG